jgi:diphthamide biosynthesis protein 3
VDATIVSSDSSSTVQMRDVSFPTLPTQPAVAAHLVTSSATRSTVTAAELAALEAAAEAAGGVYDEVDIEDMDFDAATKSYWYPCPCGDRFVITEDELYDGEEIARCPSCSLRIRVIYDPSEFLE